MPKTIDEIKPGFGPIYAAGMYPKLAKIFQKHGYALAVHGSVMNDFDLIAVPWVETVSEPEVVLADVYKSLSLINKSGPSVRAHGRRAYMLNISYARCALDISFVQPSGGWKIEVEPRDDE